MEAAIKNYRGGKHTQKTNQMVVVPPNTTTKEEATKLVGKSVTYNTGKKDITGKITGAHGNSGAVKVLFETGMPGQAISKKVKIN
ncbi:50S ribosomal protein L35ae [Candidatus Woesearchaeota archaeon]|nr:50S ribosomal protein L35ae [Candidatus Woesearchaeota archaeon]|tara:strand:- start:162 stop:416 length:255 start_codon:yes stop_codon:yes gene_type:complete